MASRRTRRHTRTNGTTPGTIDVWYDRYSVRELRDFVKNRTQKLPPKMDKLCYVQRLVELDQDWTFRLMDLPAELRNAVYGHLLRLRQSQLHERRLVCSPNILATCKQVHEEGVGLLYTVNEFSICLRSTAYAPGAREVQNLTTVEFGRLDVEDVVLRDVSLSDMAAIWPVHIRKAESIKLVVHLTQTEDEETRESPVGFEQVNHVLHSLLCTKGGAMALKQLRVVLKSSPSELAEMDLRSALYPLAACRNLSSAPCRLEGLPDSVTTYLGQQQRRQAASRAQLESFEKLRTERRRAMRVYSHARGAALMVPVIYQLAVCIREATVCLDTDGVYIDEAFYARCSASLTALRACLAGSAVRELEAELARPS